MKGIFSAALLRAAEKDDFRFWFFSMQEEVNYAIRTFTSHDELYDFEEKLTQDGRTLFLLFLAEVFKEHGL
jgi:hypothetical protein